MDILHSDRTTWLLGLGGAALGLLLLAGCASTPGVRGASQGSDGIHVVENRPVDSAVRQDFARALELLEAGQYPQAIDLLEKVTTRAQNHSAPFVNLAKAYVMTGNYDRAEANLDRAMQINPGHPVTLHELALLYRETGRYDDSRQVYETLTARYPEFMPARKNFGILCELYLDDPACALKQYRSYIDNNPGEEDVKLWILGLERRVGG
ncbi:MAG TPA: tetratricopeptide repeat protein [Thioalkalivibrio sp.]|nr:tetratricopeptide repeat protein [Thioalkalivibrio sp.]